MGYWDEREPKKTEIKAAPEDDSLEKLESECLEEIGAVEKGFRERMKVENDRFRDMCDTEYWFCACFTSRAQKEEFLRALNLDPSEKYIDGRELARAVKRPVKTPDLKFAKIKGFDKEYSDRAMEV